MGEPPPLLSPVPSAPVRPPSVTVIAVFVIVMGTMSLLSSPLAILPWVMDLGPNPVLDIARRHPVMHAWSLFSVIGTPLLSLVLVVCGIGLLGLRGWAWRGLFAYAFVALGMVVIGTTLSALFLVPGLLELEDPVARISGLAGMALAPCTALGLTITLLAVLTRPAVKAAFRIERHPPERNLS